MAGGKRRIPMKRRKTKEQRAVSFSKRRRGLLNKAAEYCLRTRSQLALLVSSPASDKAFYTFGHSSVDAVFDTFMSNRVPEAAAVGVEDVVRSGIQKFNEIKDLELDQKKGKEGEDFGRDGFWEEYNKLGKFETAGELQVLVGQLVKAREKAIIRMNELMAPQVLASGSSASDSAFEQVKFGIDHVHGNGDNEELVEFGAWDFEQEWMKATGLEHEEEIFPMGAFFSPQVSASDLANSNFSSASEQVEFRNNHTGAEEMTTAGWESENIHDLLSAQVSASISGYAFCEQFQFGNNLNPEQGGIMNAGTHGLLSSQDSASNSCSASAPGGSDFSHDCGQFNFGYDSGNFQDLGPSFCLPVPNDNNITDFADDQNWLAMTYHDQPMPVAMVNEYGQLCYLDAYSFMNF